MKSRSLGASGIDFSAIGLSYLPLTKFYEGPDETEAIRAAYPISALQTEYASWVRNLEQRMLNICREIGAAFVAYSTLGRGFLSGAIDIELSLRDMALLNRTLTPEAISGERAPQSFLNCINL